MEGCLKNGGDACPKLLDLISKEREWLVKTDENERSSEEKKLELRLGPPCEEYWSVKDTNVNRDGDESLLSLNYFKNGAFPRNLAAVTKESSQHCCTKVVVDLQQQQKQSAAEKKAFSPPATAANNTAVHINSSQKRTAPGPVVGWPPIRSFRRNLASSSSSSKQAAVDSQNGGNPNKKVATTSEKPAVQHQSCKKGMFVKINMDGVPIGRKVDLSAYDTYEKLSAAVDELFRGLLAAQRDSSDGGIMNKQEEEKAITGVLDGSGKYTLVYEDNEGDRMLVGDVPWHMFVSTVKRLRVLKSSEVSALSLGSTKQARTPLK